MFTCKRHLLLLLLLVVSSNSTVFAQGLGPPPNPLVSELNGVIGTLFKLAISKIPLISSTVPGLAAMMGARSGVKQILPDE